MNQPNSLQRHELPFLYLPGDNPREIAQRTRRRREADLKKLQDKVMNILVVQYLSVSRLKG